MSENFADVIRKNSVNLGNREALTFIHDLDSSGGWQSLTYKELDRRARSVASALLKRCRPGDRALLLYPEGLDFAVAFVGCLYAGVVAVPSPLPGRYKHHQRRVSAIATDARVSVVLTDAHSLAGVEEWAAGAGRPRSAVLDTGTIQAPALDPQELPALDTGSVALLQYTSGSTGNPKGVVITHGNLVANVDSLGRAFGLDADTRFGSWIPHYHDMGLMGILLPPLYLGGSCVQMSPTTFLKRPHWWLRMVDEFDIHWTAGPNFAYELCSRRITDEQLAGLDLSRLKFACNGSEPVQAATLTAFAKRFAATGLRAEALNPSYGMAEATVFVSGSGHRKPVVARVNEARLAAGTLEPTAMSRNARELISCGWPADYDVKIVDPRTAAELPDGTVGEIWLRGPSVALGYWGNDEATASTFRAQPAGGEQGAADGGYLRTGDLGATLDGELYITGRLKEMLIVRGRNLFPQDIEYEVRSHHPELQGLFGAAFTVPVRDADGAEEDLLVLVHELRGRRTENELKTLATAVRRTVAQQFGTHLAGLQLVPRGSVPRTTSGKIQRLGARDAFRAREGKPLFSAVEARLDRALS
ncbi:fatty acyl-AMP ligase [Streptomyces clavifer]|uniref:fatty acyl-AMP ligase n=1 Tax=Streptomyces clavifer TaxID=68188 RepID=UPI0033FD22E5